MPSQPCVGDAITLPCEILVTVKNVSGLASAVIRRNGEDILDTTPNHRLLRDGVNIIGVVVSNVTLADDDVEYTCDTPAASPNIKSSLTLNVTGKCVYTSI